jgi:septal ring-binding cell division protein DamX
MAAKPAAPVVTAKPPAAPAPPKGHFTLQLSSFPDKSEAEAYAKRFTAQGAFIVASEIPGKGTWYRVRVGNYGSSQEAIAAKGAFEKQTNTIAYIAGR